MPDSRGIRYALRVRVGPKRLIHSFLSKGISRLPAARPRFFPFSPFFLFFPLLLFHKVDSLDLKNGGLRLAPLVRGDVGLALAPRMCCSRPFSPNSRCS